MADIAGSAIRANQVVPRHSSILGRTKQSGQLCISYYGRRELINVKLKTADYYQMANIWVYKQPFPLL